MSRLPALATSCTVPAPVFRVPHGDAVSVFLHSSGPLAFIPSSSISDPAESSSLLPLHPLLTSLLSSWPSLLWRSPLSPLLLTWSWSWPCLLLSVSAVILPCAVFVLLPVSASLHGRPADSPFHPPYPDLLPPSSLGPLRPLASLLVPLPLTLAANIARRYEYVGDRTGRVVACWSVAGRSTPCRKSPGRLLAVVWDGMSRPLFLRSP